MTFTEVQQLLTWFGIAPAIEYILREYESDPLLCKAMIADICRFGSVVLQNKTHNN